MKHAFKIGGLSPATMDEKMETRDDMLDLVKGEVVRAARENRPELSEYINADFLTIDVVNPHASPWAISKPKSPVWVHEFNGEGGRRGARYYSTIQTYNRVNKRVRKDGTIELGPFIMRALLGAEDALQRARADAARADNKKMIPTDYKPPRGYRLEAEPEGIRVSSRKGGLRELVRTFDGAVKVIDAHRKWCEALRKVHEEEAAR